ncbi:MAG: ABC transporter permease, partial [Planctomycetota bacterium JB042]
MKLASRIAWRSLASRPGRTLTSVLGIAVGVAAVLSVLIVDHNTILTERLRRPSFSGKPDLEIRPVDAGAPSTDVPAALERHASLREVRPVFFSRIRLHPGAAGGEGAPFRDVELVAVDPRAGARFDAWVVSEGEEFSRPDASDVLIAAPLAAELGVGPGDSIGLQRALPSVKQCREGEVVAIRDELVQGEVEPFRVAGLLEPNHLGRRRAVIVPYARGVELFRGAHVQPIYWARMAPEAIYQDVREDLKASFVVDKPKGALVGERVDQRAFRKSIRIAACLSLLLGLFVIYNAFSLSLVERVREIGLLRALGLTGREITAAVLLEGLFLSIVGAAAGLAFSLGVVDLMRRIGITTLGYGKPLAIHDIPWDVVGLVLLAGVLAAMFGMIAPLLRVRRLSVIEAVRAGQIAYKPDPTRFVRALVLALLPGALLVLYMVATPPLGDRQQAVFWQVAKIAFWVSITFGAALLVPRLVQGAVALVLRILMAFRPVERPIAAAAVKGAHHRVFGSTLGIALVLAAVLGIHAITASLKDEASRFGERTMRGRVFLQTRPLAKEEVARAAEEAGASAFYSLSAEVLTPFPIRGIDPDEAIRFVPALRDDPREAAAFREGRSMILSEFLADNHGYALGDRVSLSTYAGAVPVR